jgi:hypothetical protein
VGLRQVVGRRNASEALHKNEGPKTGNHVAELRTAAKTFVPLFCVPSGGAYGERRAADTKIRHEIEMQILFGRDFRKRYNLQRELFGSLSKFAESCSLSRPRTCDKARACGVALRTRARNAGRCGAGAVPQLADARASALRASISP